MAGGQKASHPRNTARGSKEEPMTSLELILLTNACIRLLTEALRFIRTIRQP